MVGAAYPREEGTVTDKGHPAVGKDLATKTLLVLDVLPVGSKLMRAIRETVKEGSDERAETLFAR